MTKPKKISHIGIAVKNLEQSVKLYTETLGFELLGYDTVESEQVKVAFLRIGESRIELLEPLSDQSAIAKFIEKKGEGFHHIAFEVENIEDSLLQLKDSGVNLIHETPKLGAHNHKIAFLHPKSTNSVLMEWCEPTHSTKGEE